MADLHSIHACVSIHASRKGCWHEQGGCEECVKDYTPLRQASNSVSLDIKPLFNQGEGWMGAKTHKEKNRALKSPKKNIRREIGYSVFSVRTADRPDSNSVSVCSSYYTLWADDANCLLSYLDAHTKGNPHSRKMDNQLWKSGNVCFISSTSNNYTFFTGWFSWRKKQQQKKKRATMVTDSFSIFPLSSPLTPSPSLSAPIANDSSNMHSCSLTGRAFEFYCYAGSCESAFIVQQGCYYRLNTTGTVQPLCVMCLLQSGVDCVWSACDMLRLRVWLPLGPMNTLHLDLQDVCTHES